MRATQGREISVPRQTSGCRAKLPARLCNARKHPSGSKFAEGNPGKTETAQECTTTTGDLAAVDQTGRARVTREHGKANVVLFSLKLETECSVFLDSYFFARVASDPTFLSHNSGGRCYGMSRRLQAQSRKFSDFDQFLSFFRLETHRVVTFWHRVDGSIGVSNLPKCASIVS